MPAKKRGEDERPIIPNEIVVQTPMEDVMHQSMMPYAEHVILERALPRVEDGLKPVQRRILYAMHELAMQPDKPHRKCARIVGDCLGKYHPHGDTSVYDAMVRMAQPFAMRGMLVDGHGNFGSIDGDSAAAMRYTEARMAPLATEMLRDIEKDTVPFRLNFDDTLKEPDMLPARYPNLLVNGASGIAVGLATNIPPHNLGETIDAVLAQIDDPAIDVAGLMRRLPAPDFPTGGQLVNSPDIAQAYATGRGRLLLRAKVDVESGPSGRTLLVVSEMPYQVSKAALLAKILQLSEEKKTMLGGIYDIRDESDRTGMRAVIELKRDVDAQKVLAALYKYSDLQVTFGVNMVAIANGKPVQLGLKEAIAHYIDHQKRVVTARTAYDLDQAKARQHVLAGLMVAVDNLDAVLALIRASKNAKEAREGLVQRFSLTEIQAQAILDLRLQRLTGLEIVALRQEYAEIVKRIAALQAILASEKKLLAVIKGELADIRGRYADARRTQLISQETDDLPEVDDKPVAEEAVVVFTRGGYLRRMWPKAYEKLPPPDDEKEEEACRFQAMTDHTLYFFTDKGNCYTLGVGQIPETNRPKDRGLLLSGLLAGLEDGESPVQMLCLPQGGMEAASGDLLFVTAGGMVKRTAGAEYAVRKQKYAAISLRAGDALRYVAWAKADHTLLCISRQGMSIHFSLEGVPATGRVTGGVKGMQLDRGDSLCWCGQVTPEGEVLVISDRGYAKRVLMVDFDLQNRNGKGLKVFTFNKNGSNGSCVAAACAVKMPYTLQVRQKSGARTPLFTDDVLIEQRASKGKMYVLALMDDVVEDVLPPPEAQDDGCFC
ncbi:MAG: DNA topoisomerase 4 subunit A [Oscillospiraceae bacterium]|jgi:DNA gyrase subunit A|nr:DNA topoisomerase 4 subunit A [Oscillospiraceae bacterium]